MCVILYAPTGKSIQESKIKVAFENNPDGAGVMWYDAEGGVHYRKGFTDENKLCAFFKGLGTETPRAIHCRIATSGKVSTKTCHPFPIVESIEEMGEEKGDPKLGAMMHNGVFSSYTPKGGMACEYSDTMNYDRYVIFPLVSSGVIENPGVINLLSEMTSRILLFLPNFMVGKFGTWYEDKEEGFLASNDSYKYVKYLYHYPCYTNFNDKDWWKRGTYSASYLNSKTTTTEKKEEEKEPSYTYSIVVNADTWGQAYSLMDDFLEDYSGEIYDEDYAVETLNQIDTGLYEFCFDSFRELEALKKIEYPYFVSYFAKIAPKEKE